MARITPETMYRRALRDIEASMGSRITSDAELDRVGQLLFREKWAGAVPSDVPCNVSRERPYGIVNTTPPPGEHWMAVVWISPRRRLVYDSFGRRALEISHNPRTLNRGGAVQIEDPDQDREQGFAQSNCGQRSLAFLCVAALAGVHAARTI